MVLFPYDRSNEEYAEPAPEARARARYRVKRMTEAPCFSLRSGCDPGRRRTLHTAMSRHKGNQCIGDLLPFAVQRTMHPSEKPEQERRQRHPDLPVDVSSSTPRPLVLEDGECSHPHSVLDLRNPRSEGHLPLRHTGDWMFQSWLESRQTPPPYARAEPARGLVSCHPHLTRPK